MKADVKTRSCFIQWKCFCLPSNPVLTFQCWGGGDMAKWLGCWTCILVVSGSSPSPCHLLDLFLVALSSTPWWHHVNSQVVCLLLVGILKHFVFVSVTVKQYWIVIEMVLFIKYCYHYTMKFCLTLGTETKKSKKIPIT